MSSDSEFKSQGWVFDLEACEAELDKARQVKPHSRGEDALLRLRSRPKRRGHLASYAFGCIRALETKGLIVEDGLTPHGSIIYRLTPAGEAEAERVHRVRQERRTPKRKRKP